MLFRRLIQEPDVHQVLPTPGTDLLPNPSLAPHPNMKAVPNPWLDNTGRRIPAKYFDRGWNFDLHGYEADEEVEAASIMVGAVPSGRPLEVCFKASSEGGPGGVLLLAFGFDDHGNRVFSKSCREVFESDKPTSVRRSLHPCRDVRTLKLFFQRTTTDTIHLNKVRLIVGVPPVLPRTMDLCGAGLMYASARTHVLPRSELNNGSISFPIPIMHGNQVPVAFELSTTPRDALRGFRWELMQDETNVVCHAVLDSPQAGVEVCWESLIFVDDNCPSLTDSPENSRQALSAQDQWKCDSLPDPSGLRKAANSLFRNATDVADYAKLVERFAKNRLPWARLAAAMFHTQNIPSRVGITVPVDGGPHPRAYNFVEWHHPELGWTRIQSQPGSRPSNHDHVILRVTTPEEMAMVNQLTLTAPNAKWMELDYAKHFISDDLSPIPKSHGKGGHISMHAHPVMQLHHQKSQLNALRQACRRAWKRQLRDGRFGLSSTKRNSEVLKAVREQDTRGLISALNK